MSAVIEGKLWTRQKRKDARAKVQKRSQEHWAIKVSKSPAFSWTKFFSEGSDIKGNFPVLIGLKDDNLKKHNVAKAVQLFEIRAAEKIPIKSFSHIEVPQKNVAMVEEMLADAGYSGVSVYPIELGEQVVSRMKFSKLA